LCATIGQVMGSRCCMYKERTFIDQQTYFRYEETLSKIQRIVESSLWTLAIGFQTRKVSNSSRHNPLRRVKVAGRSSWPSRQQRTPRGLQLCFIILPSSYEL